MIVKVIVDVIVIGPMIVAVHVHGNAPVGVAVAVNDGTRRAWRFDEDSR